uniref:Uncharacterized protein n=1 Tax=Myotis myotis TaxID=51298 RepID=A0A7J7Z4N6_MYOMY|nr:hypothetical protein mMyoMyo1_010412 [Myotis myotis]
MMPNQLSHIRIPSFIHSFMVPGKLWSSSLASLTSAHSFIHSFNKHMLRACCASGNIQGSVGPDQEELIINGEQQIVHSLESLMPSFPQYSTGHIGTVLNHCGTRPQKSMNPRRLGLLEYGYHIAPWMN